MARVYVGNVNYKATEDDLRETFTQAGCTVTEVAIPLRHDGLPKGFAFVEVDDLAKAVALDKTDMMGRTIHVSEARPMRERGDDSGRPAASAPAPKEETVDMSDDAPTEEDAPATEEASDDDSEEA